MGLQAWLIVQWTSTQDELEATSIAGNLHGFIRAHAWKSVAPQSETESEAWTTPFLGYLEHVLMSSARTSQHPRTHMA